METEGREYTGDKDLVALAILEKIKITFMCFKKIRKKSWCSQ
jgi:hypothetical protein